MNRLHLGLSIYNGGAPWAPWRRPECFGFWQPDYLPSLVFGGMGAVTTTGESPPTVALANVPNGPYQLRTEITVAGDLGDAEYRTSLNGGGTWPYEGHTAASVDLTGSGITEQFAAGTYALDNVYTSRSAVAQLLDRSRYSNNIWQPSLLNMPTAITAFADFGGLSSLDFDGIQTLSVALAAPIPQPVTWYIVYKDSALYNYARLVGVYGSTATGQHLSNGPGVGVPYLYDNVGKLLTYSSVSDPDPHTMVGVFDSTDSMISIDSATGVSGDAGTGDVLNICMGGNGPMFKGQIGCVCGIAAHDSLAMRTRMLQWFSRYGTM